MSRPFIDRTALFAQAEAWALTFPADASMGTAQAYRSANALNTNEMSDVWQHLKNIGLMKTRGRAGAIRHDPRSCFEVANLITIIKPTESPTEVSPIPPMESCPAPLKASDGQTSKHPTGLHAFTINVPEHVADKLYAMLGRRHRTLDAWLLPYLEELLQLDSLGVTRPVFKSLDPERKRVA